MERSPIAAERWRRVLDLVDGALELPESERASFLDARCLDDAELCAEVRKLLAGIARAEDFLEEPAAEFAAPLLVSLAGPHEESDRPVAADVSKVQAALAERYEIERELGRGGMATVYLARDRKHKRPVALKLLDPVLARTLGAERFLREIEIAAGLSHPHIVPLYDSGEAAELLYYVMPCVDGESLRHRLARQRELSVEDAVAILRDLAAALAYAHRQGIVHRDIKPENILLTEHGALVTDFGVAKAVTAAGVADTLSTPGIALGTPAYMAPEQATGQPHIDHRADVYALGIVAYEMLAGQPPFVGRWTQDVLAAHATEAPEPVDRRRPELPPGLATLVMRCLEKRAADRPQTADEVLRSLDAVGAAPPAGDLTESTRAAMRTSDRRRLTPRRVKVAAVAGLIALAALGVWGVLPPPVALDENRVVVFPLGVTGQGLPQGAGEDVATLLGYALEGTAPLKWLEAADYLSAEQRRDPRAMTSADRRAIARARHAAFYIDGTIVGEADSATVILRLHSVTGDSLVTRKGASARLDRTPVTALGLRAIGELLSPLIEPGRRVDVSALRDRRPAAIANFLHAEREYRASRFARALTLYRAAVEEDSLFALAAVKGAEAASWLDRSDDASDLARLALRNATLLPAQHASFARGLSHYLSGAADSAVAEFQRVLAFDSLRSEAWMALGEVYRHLLPQAGGLDTLAEAAFTAARRTDPVFTPPLYHLAELALWRGNVGRADSLIRQYDRVSPDSMLSRTLDLMLRCVRDGPAAVKWQEAARQVPDVVLEAGASLAGGAAHPPCARDALRATFASTNAPPTVRWGALYALQSLLAATARDSEVVTLLRSPTAAEFDGATLFLLDAAAGVGVEQHAADVARRLGEDYTRLTPYKLWLLGSWEASKGEAARVRRIAGALAAKADSSRARRDSMLAAAISARAALVTGDTLLAVRRLRSLLPSGSRNDLLWYPPEALAGERFLLARILLAGADYAAAERIALQFAGSGPIVHLLYLRPSLTLLADAAESRGDRRSATLYRERRARLVRAEPAR